MRLALLLILVTTPGCIPLMIAAAARGGSETQLDSNVWIVRYQGNAWGTEERALDMVLLRSAELVLEGGFRYFIVEGARDESSRTSYSVPERSRTTAYVAGYGRNARIESNTETYGGGTMTFSKAGVAATVVGFSERPDSTAMVYNAWVVHDSLIAKYGLIADVKAVRPEVVNAPGR